MSTLHRLRHSPQITEYQTNLARTQRNDERLDNKIDQKLRKLKKEKTYQVREENEQHLVKMKTKKQVNFVSSNDDRRRSSVENYQHYYDQNEIAGGDSIAEKSKRHYAEYLKTKNRNEEQTRVNNLFEPQFLRDNRQRADIPILVLPDKSSDEQEIKMASFQQSSINWIAKPTKEGFLYFQIPQTNTYQWNFPKVYSQKLKGMQYLFVSHWIKSSENTIGGIKKFWRHKDLPHYTQTVKPHAETHLIEAAIEGNLAFLEVYTKFKGDLTIQDQQGKSALIHAILNNRKSFVKMICEFSSLFQEEPKTFANLIELTDRHGNTPLFTAIKVNSVDCLKLLVSYKVNFFHRKRNGNTCLHECAVHNSVDCLIVLASYCGQELFSIINKEGDRPIDIAHRSKHMQTFQALQKLERNMMYQNAVLEREVVPPQLASLSRHKSRNHIQSQTSSPSQTYSNNSSTERRRHLPQRKVEVPTSRNYYEDKRHFKNLAKQSRSQSRHEKDDRPPTFKNYREVIKEKRGRTSREQDNYRERELLRDDGEDTSDREYYSRLRRHKKHQDEFFGEVSYFKPADIKHEAVTPVDETSQQEEDDRSPQRDMYSSRLHASNNYTVDDIEKQKFRVSKTQKSRDQSNLRAQGYSVVETAIAKTSQTITGIASFIYQGISALKSMTIDEIGRARSRSQRMPSRDYSRTKRSKSRRQRETSSSVSFSDDQYFTPYARSKSRTARSRSRTLGPDHSPSFPYRSQQQQFEPIVRDVSFQVAPPFQQEEIEKKSIGIQADSFIARSPAYKTKNSVGVGSICIDQSHTVQQDQTIPSINKKKVELNLLKSRQNAADFSRGSIATQKLNHSRMIKLEKVKRKGKRLGKKAQQILMESKHFQSSEEDKQAVEESIKQSVKVEPEPTYLKQEVQFIKMSEAFEQQNVVEYNNQVNKMKELEKEMADKLTTQQSTSNAHYSNANEKYVLEGGMAQKQSNSGKKSTLQNDAAVKDFYQQLLNNLSLTNILEVEENTGDNKQKLQQSLSDILDDKTFMKILTDKFKELELSSIQPLKKSIPQEEVEIVEFNNEECENSLNCGATLDLELGVQKQPKQKQNQLDYFSPESSMINGPLHEQFAECLSDCTFVLQERQSYIHDYGSKFVSNVFEKGHIQGSYAHNHSCYSNQAGNLSLNLNTLMQTKPNVNNSGIGLRPSVSLLQPTDEDLERLNHVVDSNLKAVLPKPKKGTRKLRSRSSMVKYPEANLTGEGLDLNPVSPAKVEAAPKKEEEVKASVKSSTSSLPPGALTRISEQQTPVVELNSSGATPNMADESDLVKVDVEVANNVDPVNIFRGSFTGEQKLTQRQLPSTRYNQEEECSIIEPKSATLEKPSMPAVSSSSEQKDTLKRPKAQRGTSTAAKEMMTYKYQTDVEGPKKSKTTKQVRDSPSRRSSQRRGAEAARSSSRYNDPSAGILSNIEKLLGGSSSRRSSQERLKEELADQVELTQNLTKIDFDLTKLDQTTTPRPQPSSRALFLAPTNEYLSKVNSGKLAEHQGFLKEIEAKLALIERQDKPEQPSVSKELSLSFEMSTVIKEETGPAEALQSELQSDELVPSSMQNPIMSYMHYDPMSSDADQIISPRKFKINSERAPLQTTPKKNSEGKLKIKIRASPTSSKSGGSKKQVSLNTFANKFSRASSDDEKQSNKVNLTAKFNKVVDTQLSDLDPTARQSVASQSVPSGSAQILADRLSKLKRPSQLNKKPIKEVSFAGKSNMSQNFNSSVMTDNSERLRDNLESFRKSKMIRELKAKINKESS